MQRRAGDAFTLVELLVVIAIISLLAAILFPVIAQARDQGRRAACISNMHQQGLAFSQYITDNDERYPLGFGWSTLGWFSGMYHYTPPDWNPAAAAAQRAASAVCWANSLQSYLKSYAVFSCPSGSDQAAPGAPTVTLGAASVAYTYNGLLHAYPSAKISAPAGLTVLWEGFGQTNLKGFATTNPSLKCPDASAPCRYVPAANGVCDPGNGGSSAFLTVDGANNVFFNSGWVHSGGMVFLMADGHAKWRAIGTAKQPAYTDYHKDPFIYYGENGFPYQGSTYFWNDTCHPYLFRPDFDFQN